MDLNATAMFVSAVQAGSLSAAAERVGVPLPTLSRRIRALELELKVQLLERSTKGIRLTEAGTRLYEHASRGLDVLAEGEAAVRSDQAALRGRLRLSLPPAFGPWWSLLEAFQRRFPDIRLSVFSTERRVDLLQDGIDVALRVGAIVDDSMVARRIASYRHILVAAPALVRRLGEPRVVDDLHRFRCAVWSAGPGTGSREGWRLGDRSFDTDPVLATNDYLHLCARAVAGDIVTELPPFIAQREIAAGNLQQLLAAWPLPEQELNLLYPSHRHPSSLVRAYLEFCRECAQDHV
jgi:DNA-binding transcriptional LysR family regulator